MAKKGSTDRRAQRTRLSLQEALLALLTQKTLARITVKEITDKANVSRQVFYLHFDSKEELLFSHIDDLFSWIRRDIFADASHAKNLQREMPLLISYQHWADHVETMRWVMQVENKDLLIDCLRDHLDLIMGDLAEHPATDARKSPLHEHTINFIAGGVYVLLREWIDEGLSRSAEEMAALTYQLLKTLPSQIG